MKTYEYRIGVGCEDAVPYPEVERAIKASLLEDCHLQPFNPEQRPAGSSGIEFRFLMRHYACNKEHASDMPKSDTEVLCNTIADIDGEVVQLRFEIRRAKARMKMLARYRKACNANLVKLCQVSKFIGAERER